MVNKKEQVCDAVDELETQLVRVSSNIHSHPELESEEYMAAALLSQELNAAGFITQLGVGKLSTAIRTVHPSRGHAPTVALIVEYDALPEIGHACGHNLIAAAALGASVAVGRIKAELPGTLVFLGTPAEEGGGGKILMLEQGNFDGVDAALMFHPHQQTFVGRPHLASSEVKLAFLGKEAHASVAPEKGANALDAIIQVFISAAVLHKHMRNGSRLNGIITDGGVKTNIVPRYAAAEFNVRALENSYREELVTRLHNCAKAAALATNTPCQLSQLATAMTQQRRIRHLKMHLLVTSNC